MDHAVGQRGLEALLACSGGATLRPSGSTVQRSSKADVGSKYSRVYYSTAIPSDGLGFRMGKLGRRGRPSAAAGILIRAHMPIVTKNLQVYPLVLPQLRLSELS